MAYYKLKEGLLLRGWDRLPWAIVNAHNGRAHFLKSQREMDAVRFCNGRIDVDLPLVDSDVRALVPHLVEAGIVEPCEPGDSILPEQQYRRYPNRYIRAAHWSVTGRCNLRCKHCYMSAPDAKYGELGHDEAMAIVDELRDAGVAQVSLTGGEPLVRKDFMDIVDRLLEYGIRISQIYSNGMAVSEKLLQALDSRGVHPEFNMSYDGPGKHDWLRGVVGAEKAVDRAFLLCRDMGFPTGAEMCIHEGNKDLLRETVNHLSEVGCSSLKTNPISDIGAWHEGGHGRSIATSELLQIYLDYVPQYHEDGMPLSILLGGFFSASPRKPGSWDVPVYRYPRDPERCCVCNHARQVMYISPEGRVLPCMALSGMEIQEEFPLLGELGLTRCLTDSRYMEFIDTRADVLLAHNTACSACAFAPWCQGGCRAAALEDSGQTDLLYRDMSTCQLYRDGWIARLVRLMRELRPEASCLACEDQELMALLEDA